jgi:catechol 2,3-dioxygenase-like lactoylglutathione lyase family enzyme
MHHASIRTADIHRAMAFYEILGFVVVERFTAGYTLACWMEGLGGRIELIQVPEPQAAADPFGDEHYVGYYHLSFDLTAELATDLPSWLAALQARFTEVPLRVLLEPQQQMIGSGIYEVAFIADADGMPLELIRQLGVIRGE